MTAETLTRMLPPPLARELGSATPDLLAAWSRPSPPDGGASAERDSMTTVPGNAAQRSRRES